jgi:hypothetical protein
VSATDCRRSSSAAQVLHFGAQLGQFLFGIAVQAGNVLAEVKGPQRQRTRKPSTTAPSNQRNGQGMALRTATRGALTVSRLRSRRSRIQSPRVCNRKRNKHPKMQKPPQDDLKAVFVAEAWRFNAC